MKRKKVNIFLIIIVICIWTIVGYKFFKSFFKSNSNMSVSRIENTPFKKSVYIKDSFILHTVDRDPFLENAKIKTLTKKVITNKRPIKRKKSTTKTVADWPKIEYMGYVKSKTHSSKLGLVRIDGVLKRLREGTSYKEIEIRKIEENQIILKLNNETKVFGKNK